MTKSERANAATRSASWVTTGASVLNGMFGDYLYRRKNGLAIEMAFMHDNAPLTLAPDALGEFLPEPSRKIVVLLHGLCCNEGSWRLRGDVPDDDTSYGALLQQDLGHTPFYLRYNTGLPIADNGAQFSALMAKLLATYPVEVDEIVIIGHSMGGLVTRSACEIAAAGGEAWVAKVSKAFYLGTPHDGADLEKFVHVASAALDAIPNPITNVIGGVLALRSHGIKDLRHGAAHGLASPRPKAGSIPWLGHAQHYLIAGSLTEDPQHVITQIFGDALVRMPGKRTRALLPAKNIKVFKKLNHMALAHDRQVYRQIRQWCADQPEGKTHE
ncbi:MAG: alpha/beta hydrolase [Herminiimonas sp.]|nr:alpha/beta hydrolase [Herminiimonas sp.]